MTESSSDNSCSEVEDIDSGQLGISPYQFELEIELTDEGSNTKEGEHAA